MNLPSDLEIVLEEFDLPEIRALFFENPPYLSLALLVMNPFDFRNRLAQGIPGFLPRPDIPGNFDKRRASRPATGGLNGGHPEEIKYFLPLMSYPPFLDEDIATAEKFYPLIQFWMGKLNHAKRLPSKPFNDPSGGLLSVISTRSADR